MWKINPELMCNKHILGEHVEMHMFVGTINKKRSLKGYLDKGFLEIKNIKRRHAQLANEMKKRKMNHKSPLPCFKIKESGKVNKKSNLEELKRRCKKCNALIKLKGGK